MTRYLLALAILLLPSAHAAPRTDPEQSRLRVRREAAEIAGARGRAAEASERTHRAAQQLATRELDAARLARPVTPAPRPPADPGKAEAEAASLARERATQAETIERAERDLAEAESRKARDLQPEAAAAPDERLAAKRAKEEADAIARARAPVATQADPAETQLASLEVRAARRAQDRRAREAPKTEPAPVPVGDHASAAALRAEEEAAALVKTRRSVEPLADRAEIKLARGEIEAARRQQATAAEKTETARMAASPASDAERVSALRARQEAEEIASARPLPEPTLVPAERDLATAELKTARRLRDREVRAQQRNSARREADERGLAAAARQAQVDATARVKQELDNLVTAHAENGKGLDAARERETRLASADLAHVERDKVAFAQERQRQGERSGQHLSREAAWAAKQRDRAVKKRDVFLDEQRARAELWAFDATERYVEGIEDSQEEIVNEVLRLAEEMEKEAEKREKQQEEDKE